MNKLSSMITSLLHFATEKMLEICQAIIIVHK